MVAVPLRRAVTGNTRFRPAAVGILALTVLAGCGSTGVVTASPGESLNAAAKRAGRDGIVKLQAGSYPAQTVNTGTTGDCYAQRATAQTRDCRTFLVPQGAKVKMGNLRVEGSGTALLAQRGDLEIAGLYTLGPSSENVVRGAIVDPAAGDPGIFLGQASRWAVYDSEVKGVVDNDGVDVYAGNAGSNDVLLDGLYVHDLSLSPDSCQHVDAVQSAQTTGPPVNRLTIRNSRLEGVQNAGYQADTAKGGVGDGIVVEDNTIGPIAYVATSCIPTPYPRAMNVSGTNLTVRGNVFVGNKAFVYPGTGVVENNTGPGTSGACSGYAWRNNMWADGGC